MSIKFLFNNNIRKKYLKKKLFDKCNNDFKATDVPKAIASILIYTKCQFPSRNSIMSAIIGLTAQVNHVS